MSIDTIGSSVYSKIPFRLEFATLLNNAFTSAIEVCFFTFMVISVKDPFATGTLMPQPPITSDKLGKIFVKAFAAPVVVGTMD